MTTGLPNELRQLADELPDDAHSRLCRAAATEIEFLQIYRTDVMAQVRGVCDINDSLQKQIRQLRDALTDCVSILLGQISGIAQKEGIIRDATIALDASDHGEAMPKQEG